MDDLALFTGHALSAVDAAGRMSLPGFVRAALGGAPAGAQIVIAVHESDPCLSGYGPAHGVAVRADLDRRRIADEAAGRAQAPHHRRARRAFGLAERGNCDAAGAVTIPPLMRERARIGARALLLGAGGTFEIWSVEVARASGEPDLRMLAEYHLAHEGRQREESDR